MLAREEFEELFDHYFQDVVSFLHTYSNNRDEVEDWTQEIFLKLWEKRDKIDFEHPRFKSYLIKTARNHALKSLQKEQKYNRWLKDNLKRLRAKKTFNNNKKDYSGFEEAYKAALSKIPPRSQEAYLLSREDGLTYNEIAAVMGVSVKTVEAQISKSLKILRNELTDFSKKAVRV